MEARVGVLGVPVPCRGQADRRDDSIPAHRRAAALAELSPARLCLIKVNAFADVLVGRIWDGSLPAVSFSGLDGVKQLH